VGVRDNRIVKIKGDPDGFLNKGYVCPKGLHSADRLTHPERLKHPLKRVGPRGANQWQRISWPEAIEIIGENLLKIKQSYGARSVVFCQGMPKGLEHFSLIRLANCFGSPNVIAVQDVCHAPREVAGLHTCGFYPVADFHHPTRLALVWGSNVTSTNEEGGICSLLLHRIQEGTRLIVVDPRRTHLARKAESWLPLRPGTDSALALAFLNVVIEEELYDQNFVKLWTHGFEQLADHVKDFTPEKVADITWVDPELIRTGARAYARAKPAAIQWGNAIEQNHRCFHTTRALVCLMAICGNLDVAGGNIQANDPRIIRMAELVRAEQLPSKQKEMLHVYHGAIPRLMSVPPAHFRKAVLEGFPYPVKAAYMQCTNPLITYAESPLTYKALQSLDFLAVSDIFMTPTALLADLVLPAATSFEFNDIGHCGLGHGFILARPKVVDPPDECWPDIKILNEIGKRITSPADWFDDYEELLDEILKPGGLPYAPFIEKGHLQGADQFRKYLKNGFKTPSTKVELVLSRAPEFQVSPLPDFPDPPRDDPRYPLVLTSCKSRFYLHSSYRWLQGLRKERPYPKVEIHPQTATHYGLREGDEVTITTLKGSITQIAHLTEDIHPRVINAAYGWWFPEDGPEELYHWQKSNYNMLTSADILGKEFGTPDLKGINCRIQRKE
jgi:anaerobic selenocysteine-containing dehydrogenase